MVRTIESEDTNHICNKNAYGDFDNLKHCVVCDKKLSLTEQYYIIDDNAPPAFCSSRVCSILCQETFVLQNM
jgi:hypothetical protein